MIVASVDMYLLSDCSSFVVFHQINICRLQYYCYYYRIIIIIIIIRLVSVYNKFVY